MRSGSLINDIRNVHDFQDILPLKKNGHYEKFFCFPNNVSVLFDWTYGKYFVIFAVMQNEERALMNNFESPICCCSVRYVENLKLNFF